MAKIKVLVEAAQATAAAPLGPALGPLGVNVGQVVAEINKQTEPYQGMKVPVEIEVDSKTRKFSVTVGSPPMSALIKKELGITKGAQNPKTENVGNLSLEQAIKIAKNKMEFLNSYALKSAVKEVLGTADSMGITIEGEKPREYMKRIDQGKLDEKLKG
jgi:large subunit ribosomal protein L11